MSLLMMMRCCLPGTINDSNDNNEGQMTSNNYPVASDHDSTAKIAKATTIASWQHHTK